MTFLSHPYVPFFRLCVLLHIAGSVWKKATAPKPNNEIYHSWQEHLPSKTWDDWLQIFHIAEEFQPTILQWTDLSQPHCRAFQYEYLV